jgi:bacillithiol system protein YtxJ
MSWWKFVSTEEQLNDIVALSKEQPVMLYKHSTRCSISLMAKKVIESEYQGDITDKVSIYLLDLLNYRSVSDAIALRFGVTHASPQILLIKDGKCVYNTSHEDCSLRKIKSFI